MRVVTSNLYEAAYLLSTGVQIADVFVDTGRKRQAVVFAFDGDDNLLELQRSFHQGQAMANVTAYQRCLTRLRKQISKSLDRAAAPSNTPKTPTTARNRCHVHTPSASA